MIRWNSAEARALFDEWLLDPNPPPEFVEPADSAQIKEVTTAAGAFLRRRQADQHSFSDRAVRAVRGTRRLSGAMVVHSTFDDTYTFTRFYDPPTPLRLLHEYRLEYDEEDDEIARYKDEVPEEELYDAVNSERYDFAVRQDTLFRDATVPERSNLAMFWLDGNPGSSEHKDTPFLVEDYMVIRWLMHHDPLRNGQ